MQKLLFLFIMGASILQSSFSSSLYEKKELAQTYYDSKLYDDAIIVYEEIYEIEKNLFDYNNLNLLETVQRLYKLHLLKHTLSNNYKSVHDSLRGYV